ncbi:MAG TPA: S9 family peptidase [Thermomicrobiaceae bacterium]|nr:S9 family peptidase [Thermomicrobiaceae bacterium]
MPRPIEIEDLARIKYAGEPRISPDGTRVAYVVTEVDLPGKRYQSAIWLANADGTGQPRRFTAGESKDTAPRWSPDGERLAFLSDRDGKNQLYVLALAGGEAVQLTDLKHGVADPAWSPDGGRLLCSSKIGPEGPVRLSEQSEEDRKREAERSDVKVIRALKYKLDGEGFLGDLRRHLFAVPAEGGALHQLTEGDWDDSQPAWAPSGGLIAFASNRTDDRERNTVMDIWVLPAEGGEPRRVTQSDGAYGQPAFSPSGGTLAFTGHEFSTEYGPNTIDRLWVAPIEGGQPQAVTGALDREVGNTVASDVHYSAAPQRPVWASDGRSVYTLVSERGDVPLVRVSLDGEITTVVGGEREVVNFSVAGNGTIAFLASDLAHPLEVFTCDADGGDERQLSVANAAWLDEAAASAGERFTVTTADGAELDAWLLRPPDFDASKRYPMVLEIHGGPHGMYGSGFFHEMQLLAARGYVVLFSNPRGSTGAGQEFVAAAMGDWGGVDYRDLMAVVDAALEREPAIDPARLGVTGGSYGGYMTNWIVTQTERFKAAVTMRSTVNRHNLVGTSDLVWSYAESEFGGNVYEQPELYHARSPLSYIRNVNTPLLIMHSENDYRCPIEQAEQLFTALRLQGKEAEFVRFPNESHGLSRGGRPDHRVERLERMLGWFDRYLKADSE